MIFALHFLRLIEVSLKNTDKQLPILYVINRSYVTNDLILPFRSFYSVLVVSQAVASLSSYIQPHINRFGYYQLDLTQQSPPIGVICPDYSPLFYQVEYTHAMKSLLAYWYVQNSLCQPLNSSHT